MRKIYIVPNLVTTANLYCGFYSIVASIHHEFVLGAWLILAAAVFDALDGRIARMAKATSAFGVQYDSMADLISFGMAPSILLYQWTLEPFGQIGWCAAFLYIACAALRLARFNVNTGVQSKSFFQGLASPIAAGTIATFIIFNHALNWPREGASISREILSLIFTFGLASLMVSNIRFPSFKEFNWRSRASFGYLMIAVLAMILIAIRPEVTLFLVLASYISCSLLWNVYSALFAQKKSPTLQSQENEKPS